MSKLYVLVAGSTVGMKGALAPRAAISIAIERVRPPRGLGMALVEGSGEVALIQTGGITQMILARSLEATKAGRLR